MDLSRFAFEFDCYDPHADLLELAIWAMYFWVEDHNVVLTNPPALSTHSAAPAPDSNVSNASSVTDAAKSPAHVGHVSNVSSMTDAAKSAAHVGHVSNASSVTDAAKSAAHVGHVSTASSMTDAAQTPVRVRPGSSMRMAAAILANERLLKLAYYFSATDIFVRMRAEAERRQRTDLVERLTPASVGRLLSEHGLPRDRTARGRRFRLTRLALAKLLQTYIYVFDPDAAQTTYTRHFDL